MTQIWRKIPRSIKRFMMQHAFGIVPDYSAKIGRTVEHNRLLLATRFIAGHGIEIGGLGRPLRVPPHAQVKYVDRKSGENLLASYAVNMKARKIKIVEPDIVADGETLDGIGDRTQDFVIANHVIEHFQNPIRFFKNVHRVLRDDGILFLAIPDKERTFDHARSVTPFTHLKGDFENGPEQSRQQHFEDFVTLADIDLIGARSWKTSEARDLLIKKLMDEDYSIHFHVWDVEAMFDMISKIGTEFDINFRIKCFLSSGDEGVFILEKQ